MNYQCPGCLKLVDKRHGDSVDDPCIYCRVETLEKQLSETCRTLSNVINNVRNGTGHRENK